MFPPLQRYAVLSIITLLVILQSQVNFPNTQDSLAASPILSKSMSPIIILSRSGTI